MSELYDLFDLYKILAETGPCRVDDMAGAAYHAIPAVSSSELRQPTGAHYAAQKATPASDSTLLGSAVHARIEGIFDSRFAVAPKVDRRTKQGKADWAAWVAENGHLERVTAEQAETSEIIVQRMTEEMDRIHCPWVMTEGEVEVSWFWRDRTTELPCKARTDRWMPRRRVILDVKTTSHDPRSDSFARSLANYAYHLQIVHYGIGVAAVTGEEVERFLFLVAQTVPPYGVCLHYLDAVEHGPEIAATKRRWTESMQRVARSTYEGDPWHGWPDRPMPLTIPPWAL